MARDFTSQRAKALKPWPIMGYETPKQMKGEVVKRLLEFRLWDFIFTVRWKRKTVLTISEDMDFK